MSKSPDFGPRGMDISEARGGVDVPKLPGAYGRSERRVPPTTPHKRKLTRGQKAWIWGTGLTLAAGAALGIGINKAVNQEPEQNPVDTTAITTPTTIPENVTIPPITTTTTEKSTTTTTEKPTTTTTEKPYESTEEALSALGLRMDAYDGLEKEVAIEDLIKQFIIPEPVTAYDTSEISEDVQLAFKKNFLDKRVVWEGESNRGTEMNAVLTESPYILEPGSQEYFCNVWGAGRSQLAEFVKAIGLFESVSPIEGTADAYATFSIPGGETFTMRLLMGKQEGSNSSRKTGLQIIDLRKSIQPREDFESMQLDDLLKNHTLLDFVQEGDVVLIFPNLKINKQSQRFELVKDSNGALEIQTLCIFRFDGYDELHEKLFGDTSVSALQEESTSKFSRLYIDEIKDGIGLRTQDAETGEEKLVKFYPNKKTV